MTTTKKKTTNTKKKTTRTKKNPLTVKKTSKKTTVTSPVVGFKVKHEGLSSKIFTHTVKDSKKLPKGVHVTLASAKKEIVARIKADTKKAIDRVNGLKRAKAAPKKTKTSATK